MSGFFLALGDNHVHNRISRGGNFYYWFAKSPPNERRINVVYYYVRFLGNQMILSMNNIEAGIRWWHQESKWASDFHNSDYYAIYDDRSYGVTENWWSLTVDRLSKWRAYRGSKPPNKKCEILQLGNGVLNHIGEEYATISGAVSSEPTIVDISWEEISSLFKVISSIKPKSAVFAGKACHFLFPKVFIVMDNFRTQVFEYEFYWRGMKDEWSRFLHKEQAKELLVRNIQSNEPLHLHYPIVTKIMELSHVGYKHG